MASSPIVRFQVTRPATALPTIRGVQAEMLTAMRQSQLLVLNRARINVRVRTGTLRRSLTADDPDVSENSIIGAVGAGGAGAPYASAVEYGTGLYTEDPGVIPKLIVIRPVNKKALAWPMRGVGPTVIVTDRFGRKSHMHLGGPGGVNLRLSGELRSFIRKGLANGSIKYSDVYAFAKIVIQKGQHAKPYLRPALADSQAEIEQIFLDAVRRGFGVKP